MGESRTELLKFIEDDLAKYKGILYPAKASVFEQMFKKKLATNKLHPNPDDEFCSKEIGPSFRIISEYEDTFRNAIEKEVDPFQHDFLMIEKTHPDGYMLLNGHHRWAAARNLGMKQVPVKIVNITHEDDIKKMLDASNNTKRVTFDLDEVVFSSPDGIYERAPGLFKGSYEEVRLGIPALFHYFISHDYDIWVFSSKYYSIDYIRHLFKRYGVGVTGIVTGTARKAASKSEEKMKIEALLSQKYEETITVDNEAVVRIRRGNKEFDHIPLGNSETNWSAKVMDAIQ